MNNKEQHRAAQYWESKATEYFCCWHVEIDTRKKHEAQIHRLREKLFKRNWPWWKRWRRG